MSDKKNNLSSIRVMTLGREQILNFGWKFHRGAAENFEAVSLNDEDWRGVDLPHDWSIEDAPAEEGSERRGPFVKEAIGGTATGYTLGGEGWYRLHFRLDGVPVGGRIQVLFEGVYMESEVWINGNYLGRHVNGYTPFDYDLTPHIHFDGDNVLAVRVRNLGRNSRWYTGSGIYRNVLLNVLPESAYVERWGVGVVTRQICDGTAEIDIETRVAQPASDLSLITRIKNAAGVTVAETTSMAVGVINQSLTLSSVALWSPDTPNLYTAESELRRGDQIIDRVLTPFGVRVITFDVENGMQINGVSAKLRGGCIHHDNGLLGAAAFEDAEERRVLLLKARGYNAVRGSHNPFSRAFADACDRHGMLMIEEAFDMWLIQKNPQDYSNHFQENWQADLAAMVLSARNHPSIIMWSIGNEIPGRWFSEGVEVAWNLANECHRLDPQRPVTAAINGFAGRPVIANETTARLGFANIADEPSALSLDVVGYNYKLDRYESDHVRFPQRIMYGSESYPKQMFDNWKFVDAHAYVIGDFVWTAMDYFGEAALGNLWRTESQIPMMSPPTWPWVVSNCGDLDMTGRQRAPSRPRDVLWGVSPLEMAVHRPLAEGFFEHVGFWAWPDECQSWTWTGVEGKPLSVRVYSGADSVELRLDGQLVGTKVRGENDSVRFEFQVPYAPGVLESIAYRNGVEIARRQLETVGAATALKLTPEQPTTSAKANGLSYVWVEVVDAKGNTIPAVAHRVEVVINGVAKLLAFGNANPQAQGSLQSSTANTFDGRALLILKSDGQSGSVTVQAHSTGLQTGSARILLN